MRIQVKSSREYKVPRMLEFWLSSYEIRIELKEREESVVRGGAERWYVSTSPMIEIAKDGFLTAAGGNGDTPEEALKDFAERLKGQTVVFGRANRAKAFPEWE